jgi:hypothetical protein
MALALLSANVAVSVHNRIQLLSMSVTRERGKTCETDLLLLVSQNHTHIKKAVNRNAKIIYWEIET